MPSSEKTATSAAAAAVCSSEFVEEDVVEEEFEDVDGVGKETALPGER